MGRDTSGVRGINRYGRAAQGVKVMNLREGDEVSAVALVVETEAAEAADAAEAAEGDGAVAVAVGEVEDEVVVSTDPADEPDIVPDEAEIDAADAPDEP